MEQTLDLQLWVYLLWLEKHYLFLMLCTYNEGSFNWDCVKDILKGKRHTKWHFLDSRQESFLLIICFLSWNWLNLFPIFARFNNITLRLLNVTPFTYEFRGVHFQNVPSHIASQENRCSTFDSPLLFWYPQKFIKAKGTSLMY